MSDKEYLTAQEVHQISGFARAAQQAEWLKLNGIPHKAFTSTILVLGGVRHNPNANIRAARSNPALQKFLNEQSFEV